jgi:hypothetical protein
MEKRRLTGDGGRLFVDREGNGDRHNIITLRLFVTIQSMQNQEKKPRKTLNNAESYFEIVSFRVFPRLPWLKVLKFMML